jgi:hypothetical protein
MMAGLVGISRTGRRVGREKLPTKIGMMAGLVGIFHSA